MKYLLSIFLFAVSVISLSAQRVGAPCEGCEAIFDYADKKLSNTDTLPDFELNKNQMLITGTVFEKDGKTLASNIILYIYQTNSEGIYPTKGNEKGWARRHGYIRGWVKTDDSGKYSFYTFKPSHYPGRTDPAHVHITVKEPGKNEYWLDSYEFEGDPFLTEEKRSKHRQYGGSGIISLQTSNNLLLCKRDIFLGKNIPNYK